MAQSRETNSKQIKLIHAESRANQRF